jgi:hypothetical protein
LLAEIWPAEVFEDDPALLKHPASGWKGAVTVPAGAVVELSVDFPGAFDPAELEE